MNRFLTLSTCVLLTCLTGFSASPASADTVVATVLVGSQPWGVGITSDGTKAYIGNSGGNTVSVINLASRSVSSTITAGTGAAGISIAPTGTAAYVTNYGSSTITNINTTTDSGSLSAASTCANPLWSTIDSGTGHMLYTCGNFIQEYTPPNSAITVINQVSNFGDIARYSSGNLTVATASGLGMERSLVNSAGSRVATYSSQPTTLEFLPESRMLLVGFDNGILREVDSATWTTTRTLSTGAGSFKDMVINAVGSRAYLTDGTNNQVVSIDIPTFTVRSTVAVGATPQGIALTPDGRTLVVANNAGNSVSILSINPDPASGPSAPMQQYGRTAEESCEANAPAHVNWPGLGMVLQHSGWGKSWAQWPNGGTGGYVCTRQPFYATDETWSVM